MLPLLARVEEMRVYSALLGGPQDLGSRRLRSWIRSHSRKL